MRRVRHLQGPNLKNPYSGWDTFANNLGKTSVNALNRIDSQETRAENNSYRDKSLSNTIKNQDRNYNLNVNKFIESINQNKLDNSYRDMYFGYKKDIDNRDFLYRKGRDEARDNQWENQFDFNNWYKKQMLNKPKEMSPYQKMSIDLRNEAMEMKKKAAQNKAIEKLSIQNNWDKLSVEDQQQMIDYYNKTGLVPNIDTGAWYNPFADVTPNIPLSDEQKKQKEKQLANDMKLLMQ